MSIRLDDGVDLSRSEVARIADLLDRLVDQHGSQRAAAKASGIGETAMAKIRKRPAALTLSHRLLVRIATGTGVSVEELVKGKRRVA